MKYFSADSERKSLAATAALWLLLFLSFVFIPIKTSQKHFENISLRIDSPAPTQKSEHQSENSRGGSQQQLNPAENKRFSEGTPPQSAVPPNVPKNNPAAKSAAASPMTAEQKNPAKTSAHGKSAQSVPEPSTPQTASAETQKNAGKTSAPSSVPRTETLVPSIEELMNSQKRRTAAEKPVWDESVFAGRPEIVSNSENVPQTNTYSEQTSSALAGSAAEAAENAAALPQILSGKNTGSGNASSPQISGALEKITDALHGNAAPAGMGDSGGTAGNTAANGSVNPAGSASAGGQTQIVIVSEGAAERRLEEPEKPEIIIPREIQTRLTGVKITAECDILPQGIIPLGSVQIKPAGILPPEAEQAIASQIIRWRFSAAEFSDHAQILINIISP
ncbi:MAG: hypothetical protein NC041_09825 [Bacteroides sp.]|nr:hypothetical protein [Prevotella sp.]MCM1408536.1 hypothetical protein [Treponema brennaborense]MCM1470750.1 hypothetical protein [Bacteroides sp.]